MDRLEYSTYRHDNRDVLVMKIVKYTRQGVRDLNGPRMNGTGYNGHRSTTCPHHRDPQSVPQYTRSTMSVDDKGFPVTLYATCCSLCGSELAADEG